MAKSLNFKTGVVDYEVNGGAVISFNPSDSAFIDKFYTAVQDLDDRQGAMEADVEAAGDDPKKMFALLKGKDEEMRAVIDGLFGEGAADAIFPAMNCYALADGLPVWMNLMLAVAEEINAHVDAERKRTDPRVKAITKKYDGMVAKYDKQRKAGGRR